MKDFAFVAVTSLLLTTPVLASGVQGHDVGGGKSVKISVHRLLVILIMWRVKIISLLQRLLQLRI